MGKDKKIKQLEKGIRDLQEQVGDLKNEKSFEIGGWYKHKDNIHPKWFGCYTWGNNSYGFRTTGEWSETLNNSYIEDNCIPAEKWEVKRALVREADKRGFKYVNYIYYWVDDDDEGNDKVGCMIGWNKYGDVPYEVFNNGVWNDKMENEQKFEVGRWYRCEQTDVLMCYKETDDSGDSTGYGIEKGEWYIKGEMWIFNDDTIIEATDKEVEDALIKEAKKRGFKDGDTVKRDWDDLGENTCKGLDYGFSYSDDPFTLSFGGVFIFKDGKWAEIIENKVVINGVEVTFNKFHHTIDIGCKQCYPLDDFKAFVKTLKFYDCDYINHPELGKVNVKDLQQIVDSL